MIYYMVLHICLQNKAFYTSNFVFILLSLIKGVQSINQLNIKAD